MPIESFEGDWPDHIHAPYGEGPLGYRDMKWCWKDMDLVSIDLTFMAFLGIIDAVSFESQPIIIYV